MGGKKTKVRPLDRRLCPGCGWVWRPRLGGYSGTTGWDDCLACGYEISQGRLPPTVDEMVRGLMTDDYHDQGWTDLSRYVRGVLRAVLPPLRREVRRLRLDLKATEAAWGHAQRRALDAESQLKREQGAGAPFRLRYLYEQARFLAGLPAETLNPVDIGRVEHIVLDLVREQRARIAELEAAQRWIPVTERLPEEGVVLAYGAAEYVTAWWDGQHFRDQHGLFEGITHWRPLPTGPEEPPT